MGTVLGPQDSGWQVSPADVARARSDSISRVAVPFTQGPCQSVMVPRPHPKLPLICAQATDNPTASSLFAQRLKTLREKDGFGAVLFSSHVRKVSSGRGPKPGP